MELMKLSDSTLNILENFSTINQSILIKEGSKIKTISVMRNILAEANVPEEFPKDFAIYDLKQFLNGVKLHRNPDLGFDNDSFVTISEGKLKAKYFFADPSVIVAPPDKELSLPSKDVCFQLESQQLNSLLKASAVYGLPDLSAIGDGESISLVVRDKANDTSNEYSIVVGETDATFEFNFKMENIKILPGSYNVVISEKLLSQFFNDSINYYIALEPDSTFG
jgi:hypothetical protein